MDKINNESTSNSAHKSEEIKSVSLIKYIHKNVVLLIINIFSNLNLAVLLIKLMKCIQQTLKLL